MHSTVSAVPPDSSLAVSCRAMGGASAGSKNLLFTGSRTPAAAIQPKESQHFKKGGAISGCSWASIAPTVGHVLIDGVDE